MTSSRPQPRRRRPQPHRRLRRLPQLGQRMTLQRRWRPHLRREPLEPRMDSIPPRSPSWNQTSWERLRMSRSQRRPSHQQEQDPPEARDLRRRRGEDRGAEEHHRPVRTRQAMQPQQVRRRQVQQQTRLPRELRLQALPEHQSRRPRQCRPRRPRLRWQRQPERQPTQSSRVLSRPQVRAPPAATVRRLQRGADPCAAEPHWLLPHPHRMRRPQFQPPPRQARPMAQRQRAARRRPAQASHPAQPTRPCLPTRQVQPTRRPRLPLPTRETCPARPARR